MIWWAFFSLVEREQPRWILPVCLRVRVHVCVCAYVCVRGGLWSPVKQKPLVAHANLAVHERKTQGQRGQTSRGGASYFPPSQRGLLWIFCTQTPLETTTNTRKRRTQEKKRRRVNDSDLVLLLHFVNKLKVRFSNFKFQIENWGSGGGLIGQLTVGGACI